MRAIQLASMIIAVAASPILAHEEIEADISSDGVIIQSNEERFQMGEVVSCKGMDLNQGNSYHLNYLRFLV